MQRVNNYSFYSLGNVLKPLANIQQQAKLGELIVDLFFAQTALETLLNNQLIPLEFCRPSASNLLMALKAAQAPLNVKAGPAEAPDFEKILAAPIPPAQLHAITSSLQVFEHNLAAELQQIDTYFVSQKGIYSTGELIERAENLFSNEVREHMAQEAIIDIRQAGRCIAFDLPTAAGFHILRAVEAMITRYMAVLGSPIEKDGPRNWGIYMKKLKDARADEKIVSALDQIRDLHRNPTVHPEVFLSSEEALALLGVAQSAILGIVADIRRRSNPTPTPAR